MGKILIADDEPTIAHLLALALRTRGYDVATANDGAEALRLCRLDAPRLLISDVKMPILGGLALVRAVRAEFPSMRCILMSGGIDFEDDDVRAELEALDLAGTFGKPFIIQDVFAAVERALSDIAAERIHQSSENA